MIVDQYIDQRTLILLNRSQGLSIMQFPWLSPREARRLAAWRVLDMYYAGVSNGCIVGLKRSYDDNWQDSCAVYDVSNMWSDLVLQGLAFGEEGTPALPGSVAWWATECGIFEALGEAEAMASYLGDVVVKVTFDSELGGVVLVPLHPGTVFWHSKVLASVVLEVNEGDVYVEQYQKTPGGGCIWRNETVSKDKLTTAMGNQASPMDMITAAWEKLPCTQIPLVHIPNRRAFDDGYGVSDFSRCLGIVDALSMNRTNQKVGEDKWALPPIFISGEDVVFAVDKETGVKTFRYDSGDLIPLGKNGNASMLGNSDMLAMLQGREDRLMVQILKSAGLTEVAAGSMGDVGNQRELQIKLMFGPIDRSVGKRRRAREPKLRSVMGISAEMWRGFSPNTYGARFGKGFDLAKVKFNWGALVPEDVQEKLSQLTTARNGGLIDRESAVTKASKLLGTEKTVAEQMAAIEAESAAAGDLSAAMARNQ
jgi:hypothetical protein